MVEKVAEKAGLAAQDRVPPRVSGGIQFVIDRLTMDSGPAGWFRAEGTSSGMEVTRTPHASFESPSSPPPAVYSESRNYCDQLLYRGRGFPLYVPKPDRNLPLEYQREGVAIGDVGTVTTEGNFDFFFNIYLPANHPINAHIPEDFVPLPSYDASDVRDEDIEDANYVTSPSVRETNGDFSVPGGEFVFACRGPNGAVLALPHGRHLRRLRNILEMREYAAEHAHRWYKHVNEARGRGLVNGSLYLVTGCEKAKSWGMASFYGISLPGQHEFQLSFRPTDANTGRYRWRAPNCDHKQADPPPVDGTPLNQTIFIHAFTISLSETIWGSLFGHVEVAQLVGDSLFPGSSGRGFIPYGGQGSSFIWSLFGGSHGTTTGGRQCSAGAPPHKNVILSDASPIPRVFHPSQMIHERILRQASRATVVITHDDDWRDIFKEAGKGLVEPTFSKLQQAIFNRSEIMEQGGTVFLRPKSKSPELKMELTTSPCAESEETESRVEVATSSDVVPVDPGVYRHAPSPDTSTTGSPGLNSEADSPSPRSDLNPADFETGTQNHNLLSTNASNDIGRPTSRLGEDFTQKLRLQDGPTSLTPPTQSDISPSEGESGRFRPIVSTEAQRRAAAARRKRAPRFFCEICGAGFTARHNLRNHLNAHNSIKDFGCVSGGRGFSTEHVLKRERRCRGISKRASNATTSVTTSSVSGIGRPAGIPGGAGHSLEARGTLPSVTSSVSAMGEAVGIGGALEHGSQAVKTEEGGECSPRIRSPAFRPIKVDPPESAVEFALARSEVPNTTSPMPAINATAPSRCVYVFVILLPPSKCSGGAYFHLFVLSAAYSRKIRFRSPRIQDTADTDLKDDSGSDGPSLFKPSSTFSTDSPQSLTSRSPYISTSAFTFTFSGGAWKSVTCIIENKLYLGNLVAARSTRLLAERRITHVLSVCNDQIPAELPESGMTHMRIPIEDVNCADLLIHLPSACQFIDRAIRFGGAILVHDVQACLASASISFRALISFDRVSAVVQLLSLLIVIMWSHRMSATKALETIRRACDRIWVNPSFHEQLVLFELCRYQPSPSDGIYLRWRYKLNRQLEGILNGSYGKMLKGGHFSKGKREREQYEMKNNGWEIQIK
ncbi:WD40 containing domain protein [Mycena sanguinolenta]|uniref:protein-tyrosine-phosphatase n=1 Tax=Mycena sanguinolenta TaxID=230812 RepID=A0A8H6Z8Q1_9AGAR|nr:WD40 containing domain protein [Mycena sanguinolenta]